MRATVPGLALGLVLAVGTAACSSSQLGSGDGGVSDGGDAGAPDAGDAGQDAGDGGPDAGPAIELGLSFHRLSGELPSLILAFVTATDGNGQPVSGLDIAVDAGGAVVTASEDAGFYVATLVPPFTSGELPVAAQVAGGAAAAVRSALVLPTVGAAWDQAEPVAGLVNTPGTEDSSTISPDGQWLIVGTYSPVDIFCCGLGCGGYPTLDADNPACLDVVGPVTGPTRPGMPGAERVSGASLVDWNDAQMCAELPDGGAIPMRYDGGFYPFVLPPVADYGFHRQADGSYAEPFLIDTGSDGFVAEPFCFTFLGSGDAGGTAPVIFAFNTDAPDGGKPHPWFGRVALGQPSSLGSYMCELPVLPGYPTFTANEIAPLPVGPAGQQAGNTSVASVASGLYLMSDDELANPPYVEYSLADGDGGYSDWAAAALPEPGVDRRQPVAAGGRLYYYRAAAIASVAWNGGDPGDAGSFSDLQTELAPEAAPSGRVGEVVAIGQPTFAVIDGGAVMFFVYYRRAAAGFDGQIGTVPVK